MIINPYALGSAVGVAVPLSDNFDNNSIDLTRWAPFADGGTVVTEVNGQLEVQPTANVAGYAGVRSVGNYNFTGKTIGVRAKQWLGSGAGFNSGFEFVVRANSNNYIVLSSGSLQYILLRATTNGVHSDTSADLLIYSSDYAWRFDFTTPGTVNLQISSSPFTSWSTLLSRPVSMDLTNCTFELYAGYWGTGNSSIQKAIFDDVAFSGDYDADAQAFFTAEPTITDLTQKSAVNQLILDFKAALIWTKMIAIYPFIGGTAGTHKWNLKDPRDLDAAFRIVWLGTVTHGVNGITPDGTTGYGSTMFNGSTAGVGNNSHLSVYSKSNNAAGDKLEIGAYDGASSFWAIKISDTNGVLFVGSYRFTGDGFVLVPNTNSQGFYIESRTSSVLMKAYKNGVVVGTSEASSFAIPNAVVAVGARGGHLGSYSDRNIAFASIGNGLTDAEALAYYNAVQTFQTTLGRQV